MHCVAMKSNELCLKKQTADDLMGEKESEVQLMDTKAKMALEQLELICDGEVLKDKDTLCNFLPMVEGCYKDISTGDMYVRIRVQVGSDYMSQLMVQLNKVEKLPWGQLTEYRGILYGKKAQFKLGLLVRTQVSMMKDYRPLISRIGWNSLDGHDFYCLGTELYGVEDIAVSDELMAEYPCLNQWGMCGVEETLEKVCVLLKNGNPVTYVCFLTMLYSVLRKLFERAGVFKKYVLYIYGETATYKTSVAKFFTVWRKEWKSKPIISMESTREAREQEILHYNDCLYLLDDLAPVEQKSNQKMRNDVLAALIRSVTNGEGRKKGGVNGIREINTDSILVITAEHTLAIPSIMNRTVMLSTRNFPIPAEFLKKIREDSDLMEEFITIFLAWVVENQDQIVADIKESQSYYQPDTDDNKNIRISENFQILHIVQEIFSTMLRDLCSNQYKNKFIERLNQFLKNAYEDNIEEIHDLSIKSRITGLEGKVICTLEKIWQTEDIQILNKDLYQMGDGYFDKGYYYLCPDILRTKIMELAELDGLSQNKLTRILDDNGFLCYPNGKTERTVKKGNIRFYKIPEYKIDSLQEDL